jgi:predicted DNA-binding protein
MEQQSIPPEPEEQRTKTLGIRLTEELHAQLSFIAQLTGSTITDEIRRSIESRVQTAQNDPELIARAEEVRAQIEREARARQQAIAGLFGTTALSGAGVQEPAKATGRRSSRTSPDAASGKDSPASTA